MGRFRYEIAMMAAVAVLATGCGGSTGAVSRTGSATSGVEQVLAERTAEADQAKGADQAMEGNQSKETEGQDKQIVISTPNPQAGEIAAQMEEEKAARDAAERQSGLTEGAPEPESISKEALASSASEGIDVDLTKLSATMVYSEVYNMMYLPEEYVGKTIRMTGLYTAYHDEVKDKYYFACIVQDATACCAQGIEFRLTPDYSFPEDYPEEGDEVTITGVFETYMEDGYMYCTLKDATLAG